MTELKATFEVSRNNRRTIAILKRGVCEDAIRYFQKEAKNEKPVISLYAGDYEDLSFLNAHVKWIKCVIFVNCGSVDWTTLNKCRGIVSMKMDQAMETEGFDPKALPSLEWLTCYWDRHLSSKFSHLTRLNALWVRSYNSEDITPLSNLTELRDLQITYSRKLKSVEDIGRLKKLEFLWLKNNSKLQNLSPIGKLSRLKTLGIVSCKNAENHEAISRLCALEELILRADLDSIGWISDMKNLRLLRFECKLRDGDISFLKDMENLKHVRFNDKRNYNLKIDEMNAILKERGYDPANPDPDIYSWRDFPERPTN